ncbi:MAG: hypothetical protein HOW73_11040 [Polyangiaceae bacterium]|nr:hypothetical protein [Polyangiaceae bacterium]
MVPLYGFVEGDTIGLLVMARADMTVFEIVAKLSDAASARVDPRGPWHLVAKNRVADEDATVGDLELDAFERVDLRRAEGR